MSDIAKNIGIARRTNPSNVVDGANVPPSYDIRGRALVSYQARELVATAYVSLANGTETTLLAGATSTFHDLASITGSNTSTATLGAGTAVTVLLRDTLGGGTVASLELTDGESHTIYFNPPLPQNEAANSWTVDMDDVTGTTVNITGLFIKNN